MKKVVLMFVAVFACLASVTATRSISATLSSPITASPEARTLSFAERVVYQQIIEDVYWRHRIWPKDNHDPKPALDAVISRAELETKVKDYLRNSQTVADYGQRAITAEQLQAEVDRMAQNTRQPEVLQELFEALGNDPFCYRGVSCETPAS